MELISVHFVAVSLRWVNNCSVNICFSRGGRRCIRPTPMCAPPCFESKSDGQRAKPWITTKKILPSSPGKNQPISTGDDPNDSIDQKARLSQLMYMLILDSPERYQSTRQPELNEEISQRMYVYVCIYIHRERERAAPKTRERKDKGNKDTRGKESILSFLPPPFERLPFSLLHLSVQLTDSPFPPPAS